ncbi:MAG TPA: hypothetical protein VFM93_14725 [Candidatus Limnocylindria bacterium]|nr:hypothetical protein [Candidatus Limnocylindria bacterium]
MLGLIGLTLHTLAPFAIREAAWLAFVSLLAYAALADLGVLRRFTGARQTPGLWLCTLGAGGGVTAWGFDLGLGFTTRLPYQAVGALLAFALLNGDFAASVFVMAVYGATRSAGVVVAILCAQKAHDDACRVIAGHGTLLKRAVGATAVIAILLFSGLP